MFSKKDFCFPVQRAKRELQENMTVAQTWSEFNDMLDKNKVCIEIVPSSEVKQKMKVSSVSKSEQVLKTIDSSEVWKKRCEMFSSVEAIATLQELCYGRLYQDSQDAFFRGFSGLGISGYVNLVSRRTYNSEDGILSVVSTRRLSTPNNISAKCRFHFRSSRRLSVVKGIAKEKSKRTVRGIILNFRCDTTDMA